MIGGRRVFAAENSLKQSEKTTVNQKVRRTMISRLRLSRRSPRCLLELGPDGRVGSERRKVGCDGSSSKELETDRAL